MAVTFKNGAWYAVISVWVDGKRKLKWHRAGTTRDDAVKLERKLRVDQDEGTYVERVAITVADYLDHKWFPVARTTVEDTTAEQYRTVLNLYVIPHIGRKRLANLQATDLNALYRMLAKRGAVRTGGPLGAKTIRNVHTILHRALKDAVGWRYLAANPADYADPPKVSRRKPRRWTAEQLDAFLATLDGDGLGPLFFLLATTGMRRQEALGLRWRDVNLAERRLTINQVAVTVGGEVRFKETKTRASDRMVPFPEETAVMLRAHRKRQSTEQANAGPAWQDHGLVFCQEDGSPIPPKRVTNAFTRAVERLGLEPLSPHGLRHTFATIALEQGVLTKVVADILGHSSVAITADLYTQTPDGTARAAADTVAAAIFRKDGTTSR